MPYFISIVTAILMAEGRGAGELAYLLEWNAFDPTSVSLNVIEADCSELLDRKNDLNPAVQGAVFLRRGAARTRLLKDDQARADFKEAYRLAPEDLDVQYFYGLCLVENGEQQECLKLAKTLINSHPANFRGHALLSHYYNSRRMHHEVIKSLTEGIAANPKVALLYAYRARAFLQTDEWEACLKDTIQALTLPQIMPQAVRNEMYLLQFVSLLMLHRCDEAIQSAIIYRDLVPSDPDAWGNIIGCYIYSGKFGFALKAAKEYCDAFPESAMAHKMLTKAECHFGYLADAEIHAKEAIRLDGQANGTAWYYLSLVAWKQGKWKRADEAFKRFTTLPTDDESPMRRAFYLTTCPDAQYRDHRAAAALILAAKQQRQHLKQPILHLIYACFSADEGDFEDALSEIDNLKKREDCTEELRTQAISLQRVFESRQPYRVAVDHKERIFDLPVFNLCPDPEHGTTIKYR